MRDRAIVDSIRNQAPVCEERSAKYARIIDNYQRIYIDFANIVKFTL